jgi:hypothetical protein
MSDEEGHPRAVRQCVNSSCELRYVAIGPTTSSKCEKCGSTTQVMGTPSARTAVSIAQPLEPWHYGAARMISRIASVIAILSVIGGVAVGVAASRYQTDSGGTGHRAGVLAVWIFSGALAAVLWLAVAAGLLLLVEIGESLQERGKESSGTGS